MTTTSVTTSTTTQYTETTGNMLVVASGGNVTSALIDSGGALIVSGGVETSATIFAGGTETVASGSASGDLVSGTETVSGTSAAVTNETVFGGGTINLYKGSATGTTVSSGGKLFISGGNTASNTTIAGGGTVELNTSGGTLAGTLTFANGGNTLQFEKVLSAAAGDQAIATGFAATDTIVVEGAGTATVAVTSAAGTNEVVASITSGAVTDSFTLSGSQYTTANVAWSSPSAGVYDLTTTYAPSSAGTTTSVTTSTGPGAYTETSGNTLLVLAGGSVSGAIIDNGGFLTISGGVDAGAVISAGGTETVSSGSASSDQIYGLATTISGGAGSFANEIVENGGTFDLLNGNTATGTTVLGGGLFLISGNNGPVTNTVLSGGGTLELDSAKANISGSLIFAGGGNALLVATVATSGYGDLAAISGFSSTDKINVTALGAAPTVAFATSGGNEDVTVTGGAGSETFVFSGTTTYDSSTLAVVSSGGQEYLEYNASGFPGVTTSVTTSTGPGVYTETSGNTLLVLSGGSVSAATIDSGGFLTVSGGLDAGATISAGGTETALLGSAMNDRIYGAATVDSGASVTSQTVYSAGSLIVNGGVDLAATISSGAVETVQAGSAGADQIFGAINVGSGSVTSETVQQGGTLTLNAGSVDNAADVLSGGVEMVNAGSASGDQIYGIISTVSGGAGVFANEIVENGGVFNLLNGNSASGTTVLSGGELFVSGKNGALTGTTLSGGGTLVIASPKAAVSGSLTFEGGGNDLAITSASDATYGVLATISGFTSSDKIDLASTAYTASALTLSQTVSGGDTVVNVISGGSTTIQTFTFADPSLAGTLALTSDGSGGADLMIVPVDVTTSVTTPTSSGAYTELATDTLLVLSGGSVSAATIDSGGFLVIDGGVDVAATIMSGGLETVSSGSASGDQIHGSAVVSGGTVSNESVLSGGQFSVDGGSVSNIVLSGGGLLDLATPAAVVSGGLTFTGGDNTLEAGAIANAGAGDQAVISGVSTSDKIDVKGISSTGATLSFTANGDDSVATISGSGGTESFVFNSTSAYNSSTMSLMSDGSGGVDLILDTTPVVAFTSLNGLSTNQATDVVNGTVDTTVDPEAIGTIVSVLEGGKVVGTGTVAANGYWSAAVSFANDQGSNVLTASDTDGAGNTGVTGSPLTYDVDTTAPAFNPGNLVVSISGDGDGSGNYTDNQAGPITLEQITTSGSIVSQLVLPQTTTVVNGVTEYAISGEYGSSSEGTLELSADGHSLTIAGYGVNDQTYNQGGAAVYGNAAEAQSTSVPGGPYTAVPRVIADISTDGAVDTSTALYNVFNTNNPRSVATVDGSSFYIAGQGVKGDTTQGVFYATDGASSATIINDATDTRTAEIYDDQLYVSADSTQGATNISDYGALPTSATTPTVLTGISNSVMLNGTNGNTVNAEDPIGTSVNLSPENFFFANADTLYVADGGDPKNGGLGDGGLQKWSYANGTWTLDYTLSDGLNLIPNTDSASSGDTGLIGLTGQVVGGSVQLYATTEPLNDLGATSVVEVTDSLAATSGAGESFTTLLTASPGENIRGIAFAPTPYTPTITGTVANQTTTSEAPVTPFSGVTIGDANANAVDTLTITQTGSGTLSGLSLSGSNGTYTLTGSAAQVTSELDGLSFTPDNNAPGSTVSTSFMLSDQSSASSTAATAGPVEVTDTHPTAPTVTSISTFGAAMNDASSDQFTVVFSTAVTGVASSDFTVVTTTNAGGAAVTDTGISSITGGGTTYTVTVSGVTGDGTLGLNLNANDTGITDAAGDSVTAPFTGETFTVEHSPLVETVSQYSANQAAFDKWIPGIVIVDSAANVSGAFDLLNADPQIDDITLTGTGTPALTLTVAQAFNDTAALGKITNSPFTIDVADTAADLEALTPTQIKALGAEGVTSLSSTDTDVYFDFAQSNALQAEDIMPTAPAGDIAHEGFATGALRYLFNADGSLESLLTRSADGAFDVHFYNVAGLFHGLDYASKDIAYSSSDKRTAATYYDAQENVVASETFTANGGFTLTTPGKPTETETIAADGNLELNFTGVSNQSYTSYQNDFVSPSQFVAHSQDNADGTDRVNILGDNLTISATGGTIGQTSGTPDFTFTAHPSEIFAFETSANNDVLNFGATGFGNDTVKNFGAASSATDSLNLTALFTSYSDLMAHTVNSGSSTVITDHVGDTITLNGVQASALTAQRTGF